MQNSHREAIGDLPSSRYYVFIYASFGVIKVKNHNSQRNMENICYYFVMQIFFNEFGKTLICILFLKVIQTIDVTPIHFDITNTYREGFNLFVLKLRRFNTLFI